MSGMKRGEGTSRSCRYVYAVLQEVQSTRRGRSTSTVRCSCGSCAPSPASECKYASVCASLGVGEASVPAPNEWKVGPPSPVMPTSTSGGVGIHPHAQIPLWRGLVQGQVQGSSPRPSPRSSPRQKASFRTQSSKFSLKLVLRGVGSALHSESR